MTLGNAAAAQGVVLSTAGFGSSVKKSDRGLKIASNPAEQGLWESDDRWEPSLRIKVWRGDDHAGTSTARSCATANEDRRVVGGNQYNGQSSRYLIHLRLGEWCRLAGDGYTGEEWQGRKTKEQLFH